MKACPKFSLGRLVITPNAQASCAPNDWQAAIIRHAHGDWGDVCDDDKEANDCALEEGSRLLSYYTTASGVKFWIITEADRSATTVLLPEDY